MGHIFEYSELLRGRMTRLAMINSDTSPAHAAINANLRHGNYYRAFDQVMTALGDYPDDTGLKYTAVLCLLRGGALSSAEAVFADMNLADETHEDVLALSGRLIKARIDDRSGIAEPKLFTQAAGHYEQAFNQTGGGYSGVNAASLYWMAGEIDKARRIAQKILTDVAVPGAENPQDLYYFHATQAECHFLLGDMKAMTGALSEAIQADPDNFAARASTVQQFQMLSGEQRPDWLASFLTPPCLHYIGHMFRLGDPGQDRSLGRSDYKKLCNNINDIIDAHPASAVFGSLAAGADILFAEGYLARGIDLHVVLPVPPDDFCRYSVAPMGEDWVPRFKAVIAKAQSLRVVLDELGGFDRMDLKMASLIAMGLTRLHARRLHTGTFQLSLLDASSAGTQTYEDQRMWEEAGGRVVSVSWPGCTQGRPIAPLPEPDRRAFRAMLFTDLKGYGRLPDRSIPDIVKELFAPMAKACRGLDTPPLMVKSWGDGLFVVFEDVAAAANAAFVLMQCFNDRIAELGEDLALRIGGHFGPVWERADPFTQSDNLYGRHVAIAARLEAMAMPGSIYVSETFAAVLAMQGQEERANQIMCDYVGQVQSEKEEASFPIYSLRSSA